MKRKTGTLLGATTAAAALMMSLGVGTASAAPTGCAAGGGFTYATAYCSGGTGYYQAYADCFQSYWPYYHRFVQSDWKQARSGQNAFVWCPIGYTVWSRGVGLRN